MRKEKQNIMISENESMLVSDRKGCDNLTKAGKCECLSGLKNIEIKLQLFSLKLDEVSANLNICFTKHMQCYGKLIEEQKKRENVQYVVWEMKQTNQAIQDKLNTQILKQQESLGNVNQQIQSWSRVLREMKTWKTTYCTWSSNLQEQMFDINKNYKSQSDEKIKKIYQAVEEIGLLQRKMLQKTSDGGNNQKKSRAISFNERPSLPSNKYSNKNTNESTIIYGSRYYNR